MADTRKREYLRRVRSLCKVNYGSKSYTMAEWVKRLDRGLWSSSETINV